MRLVGQARGLAAIAMIGLLLGMAGSGAAQDGTIIRGELGAMLDREIQLATKGALWGAVLVARGGEVLLAKGYGFADYGTRPNTPATLFEIASTSKPFTATAIMKLAMEKKLRLEDPITKFLDGVPADKKEVTIHQLLTHTSGIDPGRGLPYASTASRDDFIRFVLGAEMKSEPGEKFAYFNSGYALLAAIVEVVTGGTFEAYMKEKVFGPAGLTDTGFIRDPDLDPKRAAGRLAKDGLDGTALEWHWSWGYRGMGGVVTTVGDLEKWDRALRAGKILDRATLEKAHTPSRSSYACGWRIGTTPTGNTKVFHSGGVRGFGCQWIRYIEDDAMIAVLSNDGRSAHTVSARLEDLLFPTPKLRATIDTRGYELSQYKSLGLEGKGRWQVTEENGTVSLVLKHRDKRRALATITLPPASARKLLKDLESTLRQKPAGPWGKTRHMNSGVYLNPYTLADGKLELSEGLSIRIQESYVGRGAEGETITDPRVLFILDDSHRHQWPVMAHLDRATTTGLLESLRRLLE